MNAGWGAQLYIGSAVFMYTLDYNCYYSKKNNFRNKIGGIRYDSLSAWKNATGKDDNSINSDPFFFDASNDDFTLQSSSPCINTGTDIGAFEDYNRNYLPQGPKVDIGAFEFINTVHLNSPIGLKIQ